MMIKVFIVLLLVSLLALFFGVTRIYGLVGLLLLVLWQPIPTILAVGAVIGVAWKVRGHL
jgi:hypothetical protein